MHTKRSQPIFFFLITHPSPEDRVTNNLGAAFLSVFSSAIPSYIGFSLGEIGGTSC